MAAMRELLNFAVATSALIWSL